MLQIKGFLEKFRSIEDPKETRGKIAAVLNSILKADLISGEDVSHKNTVLWIKANPAIKHRVFASKQACLDALGKSMPDHPVTDIR